MAQSCTPILINNTIANNGCTNTTSTTYGAGVYAYINAGISGLNNIVYFNQADTCADCVGTVNFSYSCCSQTLAGTGNITDDPRFVDAANNDFNLQSGSPCIDTGDPNSSLDPDGTRADMGALYFDQSGGQPEIVIMPDSLIFEDTRIGEADSLSFIIYNQGTGDLIIWNLTNSLPDIFHFDWDPADSLITPGNRLSIGVRFEPLEALLYWDDLVIDNNDAPESVHLQGQGLPPLGVINEPTDLTDDFAVLSAYPNPFNAETTIRFHLPEAGLVRLEVFNIYGCSVGVWLAPTCQYPAGTHEIPLDGSNLASGVYLVRLEVAKDQWVMKVVVMR